ncbi:MAG: HupE/UreJ family protein [Hyphomicrobiales bacterium]|nr:HupE/UreJ family protein [Hyphomicrobiales bacterium]
MSVSGRNTDGISFLGRSAFAPAARWLLVVAIGWLCALAAITNAQAHRTSVAAARLGIDGNFVKVRLTLSAHDLAFALGRPVDAADPVPPTLFDNERAALDSYLKSRLTVSGDGLTCPPLAEFLMQPTENGDSIAIDLSFGCVTRPERVTFGYLVFFDIDSNHRLVGEFIAGGREEFILEAGYTEASFSATAAHETSFLAAIWPIIVLGFEHILAGLDHLLFLLALLMVPSRPATLVATVTGFTVAHSLTLALAWFDLISLPSRLVEAAIALSIAFVAFENLLRRDGSRRWIEASGFGLVHGLGFYGTLKELDLAGAGVMTRLVGFNLGVELGQLVVVAVLIGPLVWWWRQAWYRRSAIALSLLLVAIALTWTVERLFD